MKHKARKENDRAATGENLKQQSETALGFSAEYVAGSDIIDSFCAFGGEENIIFHC